MNDVMLLLVLAGGAVGLVLLLFVFRISESGPQDFPSITESQFVARLPTDIDPQVALKVRSILADALGYPYERIHPNARLMKDLGAE